MSTSNTALFNQDELAFLMKLWDANHLVGFSSDPLKLTQSSKTAQLSLQHKHILQTGSGRSSVIDKYQQWLNALFTPQQALIVVRDLPKIGKQLLVFSSYNGTIILHSQLQNGEHRIEEMTTTGIDTLFESWFPLTENSDKTEDVVTLPSEIVEQSQEFVKNNNKEAAVKILLDANTPIHLTNDWIDTIETRRYSASFATLIIQNEELKEINSFAVLTGENSQWLILQDEQNNNNINLIRSTMKPKDKMRFAIQILAETPEKKITSYVMKTNTIAYALTSINRSDVGYKILQTMSPQELSATQLKDLMKQGAERLAEIGLCDFSFKGTPSLLPSLESAIFPLTKFDYLIQTSIARKTINAEATIHVQKGGTFTSHIISQNSHVLESGKTGYLEDYLGKLFGDFALQSKKNPSLDFSIPLSILHPLFLSQNGDAMSSLKNSGVQADLASAVVKDLNNQNFRASLTRINIKDGTDQKAASSSIMPLLLLLEGKYNSWVFNFPSSEATAIGSAQCIDRDNFEKILKVFINH